MKMQESPERRESMGEAVGDPHTVEGRRGPGWRGWLLSILVAILLSVTTTFLLCGSGAFRSAREVATGAGGGAHVAGDPCCPPGASGK